MIDVTVLGFTWIIITAVSGMIAIGAGLIGFWYRKLHWIERIISVVAGLLLMYPEGHTDIVGAVIFVIMLVIQLIANNKSKGKGDKQQQASVQI